MPLLNYFKKNWKNYFLLLCIILIFFIGLEVYLRFYYYITSPIMYQLYEKDESIGYKLKVGYAQKKAIGYRLFGESYNIKINSKGLRDYDYSYKKPNYTCPEISKHFRI